MTKSSLTTHQLCVALGGQMRLHDITLALPLGKITGIVGRNGSGKSTLLKTLAGLYPCASGSIHLHGRPLTDYRTRALARELTLLPQRPLIPEGLTVEELVWFGRYPHQGLWGGKSLKDKAAVERAMEQTGILSLANTLMTSLSGGQQQRVWLAMALAQETPILLLDEPTTCLDICYQLAMLKRLRALQNGEKTTVLVLHDLNQALRYCDHLILLHEGRIVATGGCHEVLNSTHLRNIFQLEANIDSNAGQLEIIDCLET